jgi:UDP-2,4-diacetamido-2,4,6-trideoxy-beta-L-altropyranose hydrolase
MKQVVIRTDASSQIGAGHVMRCLTIASVLRDEGYKVAFIMSDVDGNMASQVKYLGFDVLMVNEGLSTDKVKCEFSAWNEGQQKSDAGQCAMILQKFCNVDVLVVDHYCLDSYWENILTAYTRKLVVIDDLANRAHACDILLDQNYFSNMDERYDGLTNGGCNLLLGPEHSLLDSKYWHVAGGGRDFSKGVTRILMFFGGADPDNVTMNALQGLLPILPVDVTIDVIIGASNVHAPELHSFCDEYNNVKVYQGIDNMQDYIAAADIAFGAGGISTWERCVSGLPTFTVSIAENQKQTSRDLHERNAIIYLGSTSEISGQDFRDSYIWACDNLDELEKISKNAASIMGNRRVKKGLTLLEYL